ncbi:NAD(P)H-binding protein [Mycobacterium sp. 050272]|uniref:SDR family oxidoreductase n=1 Tax=Mycobacterium sp. 050272 TaxID=3142488 RepID=UPI00319A79DC
MIGATGTAGSRVAARLRGRGVAVVEASRGGGVDLLTGQGLANALDGVDVVIDVSDPVPDHAHADIVHTLNAAYHNLVMVCGAKGIQRLVVSTIAGIEDPVFDEFPYFAAKRAAHDVVLEGSVPATIVRSTQWFEFATNPAAVDFDDGHVVAQDWLIQPVAADTVADVLVEAALGQTRTPRTITGPEPIRLPRLVSKLLAAQGDDRAVRVAAPELDALATGALLAPGHAIVLGPGVDSWLDGVTLDGQAGAPRVAAAKDVSRPDS